MYLGKLGRYLSLNSYIHWFLCAYVSLNMYIDILPIYYYSFLNTFQSLFIILSYLHCYVCLIYICFLPGALLFNWSVIFIFNVKVDSIIMDSVDKSCSLRVIFESLYGCSSSICWKKSIHTSNLNVKLQHTLYEEHGTVNKHNCGVANQWFDCWIDNKILYKLLFRCWFVPNFVIGPAIKSLNCHMTIAFVYCSVFIKAEFSHFTFTLLSIYLWKVQTVIPNNIL